LVGHLRVSAAPDHRIRHGVKYDPIFGYRAVRSVDGVVNPIGPWRQREFDADMDVSVAHSALVAAADETGAVLVDNPNPDIGIWQANFR
jgi:hypothetical protein